MTAPDSIPPDSAGQNDDFPLLSRIRSGAPLRVISLDGGGYLGLATATLLEGLEQHLGMRFGKSFDLFAGTSTGAILAVGLALGLTAKELVTFYEELGPAVFRRRRFPSPWFRAGYRLEPLRSALDRALGSATLGDIHRNGKGVLVTSFSLHTGHPRIFKTDHSPGPTLDSELRAADVALASAAAPTYFPVVSLTHPVGGVTENFCDGGVVANAPALIAFAETVSTLGAHPGQVRLLSISTPRKALKEHPGRFQRDRGRLHWFRRPPLLPDIMIQAGMDNAHELLARVIKAFPEPRPEYEHIAMTNEHELALDDASTKATDSLKRIGTEMAADPPVRDQVRRILK